MPLRLFQIVKDRFRVVVVETSIPRGGTVSWTLLSVNRLSLLFFRISPSGDDRARTDNLRLARAALSQLSYVPEFDTWR
jgi:hypothetical protein